MLGGLQRLRHWLLCLFLIAQIGGVLPSVYVDTLHEFGEVDVIGASAGSLVPQLQAHRGQHHPGMHDEHDECCALHHGLIGPLAHAVHQAPQLAVSVGTAAPAPTAPVSEHSSRIDRPPRA